MDVGCPGCQWDLATSGTPPVGRLEPFPTATRLFAHAGGTERHQFGLVTQDLLSDDSVEAPKAAGFRFPSFCPATSTSASASTSRPAVMVTFLEPSFTPKDWPQHPRQSGRCLALGRHTPKALHEGGQRIAQRETTA